MTPEQRRIYFKEWRAKRIAQGFCRDCTKRKAGGPNGTRTMCGFCAERHRQDAVIRHYRNHPNPELQREVKFGPVLVKREPEPAMRVTWLELSSGRSNT